MFLRDEWAGLRREESAVAFRRVPILSGVFPERIVALRAEDLRVY